MNLKLNRFILTFTFAFCGVLFSYLFLKPVIKEEQHISEKEIFAILKIQKNEVQKKGEGDILWKNVYPGDTLYEGDFVRTAGNATAEIEILENKSILSISPSTLVSIEFSKEKDIELNMISGGLLLNTQRNKTQAKVAIASKGKKVKVDQGIVNLQLDNGGEVDLDVLTGVADIEYGKNVIQVDNKTKVKLTQKEVKQEEKKIIITYPIENTIFYSTGGERLGIKFQTTRKDEEVRLVFGASKDKMNQKTKSVSSKEGEIFLPYQAKKLHYQLELVQRNKVLARSATMTHENLPLIGPFLTMPKNGQTIWKKVEDLVDLRWSNPYDYKDCRLVVAADEKLEQIVLNKSVNCTTQKFSHSFIDGKYYWKISALVGDNNSEVVSKIGNFSIKIGEGLLPPALLAPFPGFEKYIENKKSDISFSWDRSESATAYEIELIESKGNRYSYKIQNTYHTIESLPSGQYKWRVFSLNDKEKKGSAFRNFILVALPEINWTDGVAEISFNGQATRTKLSWNKGFSQKSHWTVTYRNITSHGSQNIATVESPEFIFETTTKGTYQFLIEAYDMERKLVSRSKLRTLEVKEMPLPEPPKFAIGAEEIFKADGNGMVRIKFNKQKGASAYLVELLDLNFNVLQMSRLSANVGELKNLMPGNYRIHVKTIDQFGRIGSPGESRMVKVPNVSSVAKPIMKKIRIR